jgi:hypothetical protein
VNPNFPERLLEDNMKKPTGPEDVVKDLRQRIWKRDLTLTASEAGGIMAVLDRLSQRCAEAYQVVSSLAGLAEVFGDPAVQKALDLFSDPMRPGDVLPFITEKDRPDSNSRAPGQSEIVAEDRKQKAETLSGTRHKKASAKILIPPYSPKLKSPPYPEHVIEDLRERMAKGPVTLGNDELERIFAMLEILSSRCGGAYQVVAELADFAAMTQDPAVIKVMDLLAWPLWRGDILPFNPARARERHRAWLSAKKFEALHEAEQRAIEDEKHGRKTKPAPKKKPRS